MKRVCVVSRSAPGFRRKSAENPWPAWRGWTSVGVPHTVHAATTPPTTGPREAATRAARQPVRASTAPARKSDAA